MDRYACLWPILLTLEQGDDLDWSATFEWLDVEGDGHFDNYVSSLFWSVGMITGTGSFSMPTNTTFQRLFFCILMFIAGIMNAFLIAGVVSMLERMHERRIEFYSIMDTVNSFIKEKKLDHIKVSMPDSSTMDGAEFSERLRRYYIYSSNEGATSSSWNDITTTCSPYIRSSVARMMHADLIRSVRVFSKAKACMITHLCKSIVAVVYSTRDYVVMPNDPLNNLYMIERGSVLHNGFKRLSDGDSFGEELLVKPDGTPSGFSAVCLSDTVVLTLDRDTIYNSIELFADEQFKVITFLCLRSRKKKLNAHKLQYTGKA